jgi:hypothetical protein
VTAPAGASPFSGDGAYEATVAAFAEAVNAAVASNDAQQGAARQWFELRLPADPAAHPVGDSNAPNL